MLCRMCFGGDPVRGYIIHPDTGEKLYGCSSCIRAAQKYNSKKVVHSVTHKETFDTTDELIHKLLNPKGRLWV